MPKIQEAQKKKCPNKLPKLDKETLLVDLLLWYKDVTTIYFDCMLTHNNLVDTLDALEESNSPR